MYLARGLCCAVCAVCVCVCVLVDLLGPTALMGKEGLLIYPVTTYCQLLLALALYLCVLDG